MGQMLTKSVNSLILKNLSQKTTEDFSSLFEAVALGNVNELKCFLDTRPELKIDKIKYAGTYLLHTAVCHHQLDCIHYILELGCDANIKDSIGNTPLLKLIVGSKVEKQVCFKSHDPKCYDLLLSLLLEYKADINVRDSYGRTPLLLSLLQNRPWLAELLQKHGADPNIADKNGVLPIHLCATYNNLQMLKHILELGVHIDSQEKDGKTALSDSVYCGHQEIFNELISHKCDVNKRSKYGHPLQTAIVKGRVEMVQTLLENGADIQSEIFRYRYCENQDFLFLALSEASERTTFPFTIMYTSESDIERGRRSLLILLMIIQAVSLRYPEKLCNDSFLKYKRRPLGNHKDAQTLMDLRQLILLKLAFVYKMSRNSGPVIGLPKLSSDIDTISLQNICRMKVRELMSNSRSNIIYVVDKIKYPRLLKDIILLKDIT